MKKPRARKKPSPKPRNAAAKALAEGQFRPKVMADPKAYKRHPRHPQPLTSEDGNNDEE